ncbi:MAG: helix-hairpin-helix domain-containing protein, partial [Pedobacter sp.]
VNQIGKRATKAEYFIFDPNGLDEKSWRKLGLSDRQIKVIYKYETKGGRFYNKEDFKKMYSIGAEQYLKLEPYIRIVKASPPEKENRKVSLFNPDPEKKNTKKVLIEINSADSAMLTEIRGIGPAFASRIIRYRNRLGGFYKIEQLKEVYGIDSVKYQQIEDQISLNSDQIIQININSATFELLKKHPYLSYKQMNAVLQYRRQHGPFKTIDELKKVALLNEEIIRKIEPYILFNP